MTILQKIALAIVALLSLAAGAAKFMQAPQEASFFESLGLDPVFMTVMGSLQLAIGFIIFVPKFRKIGAVAATALFFISAVMIFKTGQLGFALVSLLPAAMAVYLFLSTKKTAPAEKA